MARKFILALESSTNKTTVALGSDNGAIAQEEVTSNRYSETIIQLIDNILKKQNVKLDEIEGFIAGIGPGSFTGTRAGISTIKALAQALRKPIVGISSTKAIATSLIVEDQIKEGCNILVAFDAKRSEIYTCLYRYNRELTKLQEISCNLVSHRDFFDMIKNTKNIVAGSALELDLFSPIDNINIAPQELWLPQAKYLFSPDIDFSKLDWKNIFSVKPLYWRQSDAVPLSKRI